MSSADHWARRRSTQRPGKTRRAYRSAAAGPGRPTRSTQKPGELYVPGGNPAPDFAIGVREGENLYTDSVVVLDAKTGDYKRHYKIVPKDWHDWDVSNPPILIQTRGGKQLMAVAPKDGQLYGFDLATNSLVYRVPVTRSRGCCRIFLARHGGAFLPGRGRAARNGTAQPTIRRRTLSSSVRSIGAIR